MLRDFEEYFVSKEEPNKSCLLALNEIILQTDPDISPAWKYRMPMYTFKSKMFCYLWTDKKTQEPYIGFVEGKHLHFSELEQGNRSRMKILRISPAKDIPTQLLSNILTSALDVYKNGIVKTK